MISANAKSVSDAWTKLSPHEQSHLLTANGGTMTGTETATLCIEGATQIQATLFPQAAENLISVSAIIEKDGGEMTLTRDDATYTVNGVVKWKVPSTRDPATGRLIWMAGLGKHTEKCVYCPHWVPDKHAFGATRSYQHKIRFQQQKDLVDFVSAAMGNPPQKTFLQGIKLGLNFPGLSYEIAKRNAPHSWHTPFGHLRATPSNFHSSKPKATTDDEEDTSQRESEGGQNFHGPAPLRTEKHPSILRSENKSPKPVSYAIKFKEQEQEPHDQEKSSSGKSDKTEEPQKPKHVDWTPYSSDTEWQGETDEIPQGIHALMVTKKEMDDLVKMYGDFTGRLDKPSCDNHVAFMIFYHSKANFIKVEPIHGGEGQSKAYHKAYEFFESKGLGGNWFIGDNAVSDATRKWFKDKGIEVVIVPPYQHRANVAERMIQTFKGHFITILQGTSRSFPMAFWHHLSDQAEITINLLRPSRADPSKSAYEYVYGTTWDWDKHPMLPPGTRCVALVSREQRSSWGLHGREGWYVGPHQEGYRCYKIATKEGSIIRSDTVEWFPEDVLLPGATNEEQLREILTHLHDCIAKMAPEENTRAYRSKPLLHELSDQLLDIYHPLGPQRKLPCAGCDKPWDDNVRDEWVECEYCSKWFCWTCKTNSTLDKHERDTHPNEYTPPETRAGETEGGENEPPTLQPPPGFEQINPAAAAIPQEPPAESEGGPQKAPEKTTFHEIQQSKRFKRKIIQQPKKQDQKAKSKPTGDPYARQFNANVRKPLQPAPANVSTVPTKPIIPTAVGVNRKRNKQQQQQQQQQAPAPTTQGNSAPARPSAPAQRPPTAPKPPRTRSAKPVTDSEWETVTNRKEKKSTASGAAATRSSARNSNLAKKAFLGSRQLAEADKIWEECLNSQAQLFAQVDLTTALQIDEELKSGFKAVFGAKVMDPNTGKQLNYQKAKKEKDAQEWEAACDTEFNKAIEEYGAYHFVEKCPEGRKMAYLRQVLETDKEGNKRIRGTIGGDASDQVYNQHETSSRNASMTAKKLFMNSALSEDLELVTGDAKDFFINKMNKLADPVFVRVAFNQIGPKTIAKYGLEKWRQRGYAVLKVVLGCYGLEPSGAIAQNNLIDYARTLGYHEQEVGVKHMIFRHEDPNIKTAFALHTDDLQIKAKTKEDAQKLVDGLTAGGYIIKTNMDPKSYCGLGIHYVRGKVLHLNQPGFSEKNLEKAGFHEVPLQHTPLPYEQPTYGKHTPMTSPPDNAAPLTEQQAATARSFLGGTLWQQMGTRSDFTYANSVLISELSKGTQTTWARIRHFAGYIRANPLLGVTFWPSDMTLQAYTDSDFNAPYSRTGGFFHLGRNDDPNFVNGPIMTISKLQPISTAAANEAEYVAMFMNGKTCLPIRAELDAIGYPQSTTLFKGDNRVAVGIATDTLIQRRSKYVDAKFHWFRDRCRRGDFSAIWISTADNIADMFTKALSRLPFLALLPFVAHDFTDIASLFSSPSQ